MTQDKKRIWFIDEMRGLVIILMIIYHALYDLVFVFHKSEINFYSPQLNIMQIFIATTFITLSGVVSNYSKNNLKRGFQCLGFGMALTVVTYLFMPSQVVIFGVLHVLGCCMIIYHFINNPLKKIPTVLGTVLFLILFLFTYNITSGYLGFFGSKMIELPSSLYTNDLLFIFGFPTPQFRSSDYFSLIPWVFLFLCGSYIGNLFKQNKMPKFFYTCHVKPLAFLGQHSLIIYLFHQPVTYGILYLCFNIF